jgi:aldehyde dehydrogenase (NAD(P)+)
VWGVIPAAHAISPPPTDLRTLDETVSRLRERARDWARAPLREKADLARALLAGMSRNAERLTRAACEAKGLPLDTPGAGDEWLGGVYPVLRILRQLADSLDGLARRGNTPLGPLGATDDGRVTARVVPASVLDQAVFPLIGAEVHFEAGVTARDVAERRGRFHKAPDHEGKVVLILGAGNVNAIAPADVATKLFNEGKVCVLKMNPVNAYAGPILEDALAPAIERGFLAVVYGGKDEGGYLAQHPGVDEVHLTGATATHDALVWGPPGPERAARIARNEPLLAKEITSELGDASPVIVAPGPWDPRTLAFQAENVAGMVTQNGSFNCAAARVLVLPRGWRLRDTFLDLVVSALGTTPPRRGWYPGAADRLAGMVDGRAAVRKVEGARDTVPWTLVAGLDPAVEDRAFSTEAFCSVLVETQVGSEDPLEFLEAATTFANERLWGTLSAAVLAPPRVIADRTTGAALRRAVRRLEYGTVAVNAFTGYGFAFGATPWGGFPGQPLHDVRSGRGFVHNTRMLEGVEKTVVWQPAHYFIKPAYFPSHRTLHRLGPPLVALEGRRALSAFPGMLAMALRG